MATTSEENTITKLVFTRQIMGAEDILFGFGSSAQIREGKNSTIAAINAATIPYDSTRSVKQVLDELLANSASA